MARKRPSEIVDELNDGLRGLADIDPWELIDQLVEDVLDSVRTGLASRFPRDPSTSDHEAAMAAVADALERYHRLYVGT